MKVGLLRTVVLVGLAVVPASAGANEVPGDTRSQVMAMASRVIAAANSGNVPAMASHVAKTGEQSIIDNFPPFVWTGANAFSAWMDDVGHNTEVNEIIDATSRLGPPKYVRIDGDRAYVVVPDFFSYKRKGKSVHEDLLWTFVATKVGADWKLVSWSFSGGAKP